MSKEIDQENGTKQPGFATISTRKISDHSMKRTYFPGITDIVVVTDPAEIRTISNDSRFDRDFIGRGPVRNVQLLRKILRIFSLNGRLFAIILPRTNPSRAAAQEELRLRLNVKADEVKHGPSELEPLDEWVRGTGNEQKIDLLVQQSIGRLFVGTFTATEESLAAGHMVLEAASSSNVLKMLAWRISGRLERAKTLLPSMVNGDLVGVLAMSTARQLIVDGLHKMRQLAADPALRSSITKDAAADQCLIAPTNVVRQAKTSGEVSGCPFRKCSLFILEMGSASKRAANVTSSFSVRVGGTVPPKSGCVRGGVMLPNHAPLGSNPAGDFSLSRPRKYSPRKRRGISRFCQLPFDIQVAPRFTRTRPVKKLSSDSEIFG